MIFQRLAQISRSKYAENSRTEADLTAMLKRVHVLKVFTLREFSRHMEQIERQILQHGTTLVVVDSLASLVRREFSGSNAAVFHERAKFLSRTSAYLKRVAQLLGVSMIVANQVVSCFSGETELDRATGETSSTVIPALGSSWLVKYLLGFQEICKH